MEGGPPGFGRSFTCSVLLRIPLGSHRSLRQWGCHPLRRAFPGALADLCGPCRGPATPEGKPSGLGWIRVRSPLLAESRLISVPPGTEMFHFPGCRLRSLCIELRITPKRRWIAPFGNPWIRGHLRLPMDYRGLSRPSSPAVAKASIMRLNSLPAKSKSESPGSHPGLAACLQITT